MTVDINLILQIVILILGIVAAYLAKRGLIDRRDLETTKEIAGKLAASVDRLKEIDPKAAKELLAEILAKFGENKPVLDEFLRKMNLNEPKGGE